MMSGMHELVNIGLHVSNIESFSVFNLLLYLFLINIKFDNVFSHKYVDTKGI